MDCYYFGCINRPGHYLFAGSHTIHERDLPDDFPVNPYVLDGRLLPPKLSQTEGSAELIHFRDWTVVSFWDRSVDGRHGSNSAFVIRGRHNFHGAVEIAKKNYPGVWSRFDFEVYERGPSP